MNCNVLQFFNIERKNSEIFEKLGSFSSIKFCPKYGFWHSSQNQNNFAKLSSSRIFREFLIFDFEEIFFFFILSIVKHTLKKTFLRFVYYNSDHVEPINYAVPSFLNQRVPNNQSLGQNFLP